MHIDPVLRSPFPASRKAYQRGSHYPTLWVPHREISLSNGETLSVYDTSGVFTDANVPLRADSI